MKILKTLLILSFFLLILSISLNTSSDFNQDLGRHLRLGEIITKTGKVPKTNLFSYTNSQFPFINHHWLSEVIFYSLNRFFGIYSLLYLKIFLTLISFFVIIKISAARYGFLPTIIAASLISPLLLGRSNIRPEIFGYVLFSVIIYIFFSYPQDKKLIYFLPLVMILWVNLHISFIFGVLLILLLILKIVLSSAYEISIIRLKSHEFLICLVSLLTLFINPNGLEGALYPFNIFNNYGYPIVENQSVFFFNHPLVDYFFILSFFVFVSAIYFLVRKRFIKFLFLLIFLILSFWQVRHRPFFVLATIPFFSETTKNLINHLKLRYLKLFLTIALILFNISLIFFIDTNSYFRIFDIDQKIGIGFNEDAKKAVDFLKKNNLSNNLFNNFDIGGYLIYRLYPNYNLFIDNRPEAYPSEFIKNSYIKIQEDQNLRKKIFKKYNVNTVFFNHTDQTSWGQTFLTQIFKDKDWRLVYADSYAVILTKNSLLPDIRQNKKYLKDLADNEDSYFNLLRIFRLLIMMNETEIADYSFTKAQKINPSSCTIKRVLYSGYKNSPYFYKGDEIKKSSPYCF